MNSCEDNIQLPKMAKVKCEGCNKEYWLKFSRIDPIAYPLEDIEVDEVNKTVKIKKGNGERG